MGRAIVAMDRGHCVMKLYITKTANAYELRDADSARHSVSMVTPCKKTALYFCLYFPKVPQEVVNEDFCWKCGSGDYHSVGCV